ncbi:cytoplasmic polyadenylation element-binding protein 1 isoform X2 [Hemicordylus capensis]|uniref:cytoplasmic polyadenylation element-binding protein 1 isoform X2 n=1 Tax=Hemicordylus capensis TaxID=884348 RepID=UPI002303A16F|nr:cytoplasmic polyadenylation element-binding protein 1 isoform X2 [Hemicordylus capensis]
MEEGSECRVRTRAYKSPAPGAGAGFPEDLLVMAFPPPEGIGRTTKDCWDSSEVPALTTCSNADIFRRINAMLDNSLDFSGVCTTPITKEKRELLSDFQDSEGATASRMLFPPSAQESPRGLPDANDLCLGLQSLSLPGWDRPWSTQDLDAAAQPSTQSVLNMLGNPLGKPPLGFLPLDPIGSELTENLPTPTLRSSRLDSSRSLLYSRSSSPSDSDTSGFSSGSDHLSDLISSLRISPPLPYLPISGITRDSLNGAGSHLDQDQATLAAVTSTPASMPKQWPGASAWPSWSLPDSPEDPFSIEREARLHKQAAAVNEATCTWSGQLPPRNYKNPIYSCKVFLGGVPWDITEAGLISTFRVFGSLRVEWPGKDSKHPRCPPKGNMPKGYAYLVFESEKSVRALLQNCSRDVLSPSGLSEYYFKMSSRRMRCKEVQVIPWVLADSNFVRSPTQRLDPGKTVFVGALHGMLNAEALAGILNDLFGGVVYAGIDTDKHKYPIGSGRVTFNNQRSYLKAVSAAFVEIKTTKFTKKVQIDPYLEDAMCQVCRSQPGPFFCRDQVCFKYFCRSCWHWKHSMEILHHHRPLMRNQKNRDSS